MDGTVTAEPASAEKTTASGAPLRIWHRLVLVVPVGVADEVGAYCFELGSCGVQAEGAGEFVRLSVYFDGDHDVRQLHRELARGLQGRGLVDEATVIEAEVERDRDWSRAWRRFYRPVWATDRIVVHPPWIRVAVESGQLAIVIDPAMAFGTGGHESTQLALEAMQETDLADMTCLDVGTGSGVLTIAAVYLGVRRVTAIDTDPVAIDNAEHNLCANLGDDAARVRILTGSVDTVSGERFDVILANLEGHLLRPLLPSVARMMAAGGVALFSGLVSSEQERFAGWIETQGLSVDTIWTKGSWFSLRARRSE